MKAVVTLLGLIAGLLGQPAPPVFPSQLTVGFVVNAPQLLRASGFYYVDFDSGKSALLIASDSAANLFISDSRSNRNWRVNYLPNPICKNSSTPFLPYIPQNLFQNGTFDGSTTLFGKICNIFTTSIEENTFSGIFEIESNDLVELTYKDASGNVVVFYIDEYSNEITNPNIFSPPDICTVYSTGHL